MYGPGLVWMLTKNPSGRSGDASSPLHRRAQRLVVARDHQHRRRFAAVGGRPDDDVPEDARRDAGARCEAIAQRERDAVAALVVDGALVDRNDPLRPERVMAHHAVRRRRTRPCCESRIRTATESAAGRRCQAAATDPCAFSRAARHTERPAACSRRRRRSVCSASSSQNHGSTEAGKKCFWFRVSWSVTSPRAARPRTPASRWAESRRRRRARRSPCRAESSARACRRPSCRQSPCPSRE